MEERAPANRLRAPGLILIHSVERGGRKSAEVFLGVRRFFRIFTEVTFPLPPAALTAGSLDIPFQLPLFTLGRFHGLDPPPVGF